MRFEFVEIHNLRVIGHAVLVAGDGMNVVAGPNGSGKTSVLEAVYLLGRGRSFRSRRVRTLVRNGSGGLSVKARVRTQSGLAVTVAVQGGNGGTELRLGAHRAGSTAELARVVPVVALEPRALSLVDGGPAARRQLLDWSLFHVEPSFAAAWRRYHRALQHRNTLLRNGARSAELETWERELAAVGEHISDRRSAILEALGEYVGEFADGVLGLRPSLQYRPGWDREKPLQGVYAAGRATDRARGYTVAGPHRADVVVKINGSLAAEKLSRGQTKLFVGALIAAHVRLLKTRGCEGPVLLVDDFHAELDEAAAARLLRMLATLSCQSFLTTTGSDRMSAVAEPQLRVFHVEQGRLQLMV